MLELGWRTRLHNSDGKELLYALSTSGTVLKKLIFKSFSKQQYHKRLAELGQMTVSDHKKCNNVRHSIKPVLVSRTQTSSHKNLLIGLGLVTSLVDSKGNDIVDGEDMQALESIVFKSLIRSSIWSLGA